MLTSHLGCTVRECGLPLEPGERLYSCPRGHAYDVAQGGYLNLLQPHDRRSLGAGDSKAAVRTRAHLLDQGIGRALVHGFVRLASELALPDRPVVVDLGAGAGGALAALAGLRPIEGIGVDISAAAADFASRRMPQLTWVVANADRRLPLLDHDIDLVLSLHGRRNPTECARVLKPSGFLLIAIPASDDLVELRSLIQGEPLARDRTSGLLSAHQPYFTMVERSSVRDRRRFQREALLDLLRITYRGERRSMAGGVAGLDELDVTMASEIFLFTSR